MSPDFTPIYERLGEDAHVDESSARMVSEGVWFAWRVQEALPGWDVVNAVWWTHSGSHIVSLAQGTRLHGWGGMDYETYMFVPEDAPDDICCHTSFEAAERCALGAISTGKWCRGAFDQEVSAS